MNVRSNIIIVLILVVVFIVSGWFYYKLTYEDAKAVEASKILSLGKAKYLINEPDEKHKLPEELEEISGLTYYQGNQIICVQDEAGKIFIYDMEKRKVVREEKFGKNDDYEGVEFVEGIVYVLNSSGRIWYFPLYDDGIGEVRNIDTPLSANNDAEGLGYDPVSSSLLVATKGSGIDIEHPAVYFLGLDSLNFRSAPFIIVDQDKIEEMVVEKGLNRATRLPARPSAVYSDPISGQTLVVCSFGKLVLKYNREGILEDLVPLITDVHRQPEGITRFSNGSLLISNEGDGRAGYILNFEAVE